MRSPGKVLVPEGKSYAARQKSPSGTLSLRLLSENLHFASTEECPNDKYCNKFSTSSSLYLIYLLTDKELELETNLAVTGSVHENVKFT